MTPEERMEAYLKTPEWRQTSALIGAIMGLVVGSLFWLVSPFELTRLEYFFVMVALMCIMTISGYFLQSRAALRFEGVFFSILDLLNLSSIFKK